jgi:hypothetical protein
MLGCPVLGKMLMHSFKNSNKRKRKKRRMRMRRIMKS